MRIKYKDAFLLIGNFHYYITVKHLTFLGQAPPRKRNDWIAHSFPIIFILFSLESIFKSDRFQSFSCRCKVKTQRKVFGFNENDMKSCRRGLSEPLVRSEVAITLKIKRFLSNFSRGIEIQKEGYQGPNIIQFSCVLLIYF